MQQNCKNLADSISICEPLKEWSLGCLSCAACTAGVECTNFLRLLRNLAFSTSSYVSAPYYSGAVKKVFASFVGVPVAQQDISISQ